MYAYICIRIRSCMKKSLVAIIFTLAIVLAFGMAFVGATSSTAANAQEDALSTAQIGLLDFSLTSNIVNGAPTNTSYFTFDLASKSVPGDQGIVFSYYVGDTATIDVSEERTWTNLDNKNPPDYLSATFTVNRDPGEYHEFYFFRAKRTIYSDTTKYTYTYYYSNDGLDSAVVSLEVNDGDPVYYYLQQSKTPQFVSYDPNLHASKVSCYEINIISDASTEIIREVVATYQDDGDVEEYVTTPELASFVNTDITLSINQGTKYDNRYYQYAFGSLDENGKFVCAPEDWRVMSSSSLVIGRALLTELGESEDTLDTYVAFRAYTTTNELIGDQADGTDVYGDETKTHADGREERPIRIRWSVASPVIGVSQYYTPQGQDSAIEYEIGSWASSDVTYYISLADPDFGSDVHFYRYETSISVNNGTVTIDPNVKQIGRYESASKTYYDADGHPLTELTANGTIVNATSIPYTESATRGNLRFAAVSGDIIYNYPINCRTYIDKVKPQLVVTATDYQGYSFSESDSGAINARDNLTFTLTNNEVCESSAFAKYQYFDATGTDITSATQIAPEAWVDVVGVTTTTGVFYNVIAEASGANEYLDGRYFFRIVSGAGVVSDASKIDFSIDSSDFYFDVDKNFSYLTTADGWAYEEGYSVEQGIKVLVKVKQKGIYQFYYNITSREGSEKELIAEPVPEVRIDETTGETVYVYTCWLKEGVINGMFKFYAKNRAGVQSANDYTVDEGITIDSYAANVNIEGKIQGASSPIVEGTWVNGCVVLSIKSNKLSDTDSINVSGYKVYRVVGATRIEMEKDPLTGDYVIDDCTETMLYKFAFVTGAGVESEETYQVNIESQLINFSDTSVKIYVADENGQYDESKPYTIAGIQEISVATKLKFVFGLITDHVAPFDINLRNGDNGTLVTVERGTTTGEYVMDLANLTADGMFANEPSTAYTGSKTFTFYFSLRSVAVKLEGTPNESKEQAIKVNVNRQIANVTVDVVGNLPAIGEWSREPLTLEISNVNDIGNNEFRYQIGYGYNSAKPTEWHDIPMGDMIIGEGTTSGGGKHRVYKYVLRDHFNGTIYIRALNSAGFVGGTQPAPIPVSYDNTMPNVLRAIEMQVDSAGTVKSAYDILNDGDFTDGSVRMENGKIVIYTSRSIRLVTPQDDQYAPALFFAVQRDQSPDGVPTVRLENGKLVSSNVTGAWGTWQELSNPMLLAPESSKRSVTVYMYASNSTKHSDSMATEVTIYLDGSEPSLDIDLGNYGSNSNLPGESGVWAYHWSDYNEMSLTTTGVEGTTRVFYQVNINGTWYDLNDEIDPNTGKVIGKRATDTYRYVFDANTLFGLINQRSIQSTVTFRVVTETGATYYHPRSVKLQVDTEKPEFDLAITSNGTTYRVEEWDGNIWVSNIIAFEITPKDLNANPGGVTYSYTFGANTVHTTLHNLKFNSNNIVGLTYQKTAKGDIYCGEGWLTIYATSVASGATTSSTIYIRIDALEPEFEIVASYMENAVQKMVNSGDWVNVKEVNLELGNIGIKKVGSVSYENQSKVTVSYVLSTSNTGEPELYKNQSFPITQKTKITFTATSESGLTVVKTFEVNIDTQAPVVVSRIQEGQKYYVDERISWLHDDDTIKISTLNGVQFSRGEVVSVETINLNKWTESKPASNGGYGEGYCELYLEDLAGNKVYFYFYMLPSELTVDNITLSDEDKARLDEYLVAIENSCQAYVNGNVTIYQRALTEVREVFFRNHHSNLVKRLAVLESQVEGYKNYLKSIAGRAVGNFTLQADYNIMASNVELYNSYAKWEQDEIIEGTMIDSDGATKKYKDVFNVMIEAYYNLNAKMQVVESVRKAVQALPARMVVEVGDYADIIKAYDAYQSLSGDQKSVFNLPSSNADLLGKLFSVKARCEELMLTDAVTGVSISGEKLSEGKTIKLNVESVSKTTDDYISIQKKVISGVDKSKPRAVIALYKLYLTGDNSSNPTGTITINLTIPAETDSTGTEYRSYTAFAVYKYLADGTLITMQNVKIAPDGKSVSFEADALGSYALASNANVVEKTEEDTIYAKIGSITIDGTMIIYIAIGAAVIFGVLIIILIITGIRRRRFLDRYDRRHRYGLAARGIAAVPKGNPARRRNPLNPNEYARPQTSGTELPKDKAPTKQPKQPKQATKAQPVAKPKKK